METTGALTYSKDVYRAKGTLPPFVNSLVGSGFVIDITGVVWLKRLKDWDTSNTFHTRRNAENCLESVG